MNANWIETPKVISNKRQDAGLFSSVEKKNLELKSIKMVDTLKKKNYTLRLA